MSGLIKTICIACLVIGCEAAFRCTFGNQSSHQDPCYCAQQSVLLSINNSLSEGDTVTYFNNTDIVFECPLLNLTDDGDVKLNTNLREPCLVVPDTGIQCDLTCTKNQYPTFTVNINIIIFDKSPPKFPYTIYNSSIAEDVDVDTIVLNFEDVGEPFDPDCAFQANYGLEDDGDGYFRASGNSPVIRTAQPLDYETVKEYILQARVTNNQKTAVTTVVVKIEDVDDNDPVFDPADYQLEIIEEQISTTWISTTVPVHGYDFDTGINMTVQYSFADVDNEYVLEESLRINESDGMFEVLKPFDRENITGYPGTFTIWTDKPEKRATAIVSVNIIDVNDNLAVFDPVEYKLNIPENTFGYVTTVTATDKDLGDHAKIIYEVYNDTGVFEIDSLSGSITVKNTTALDREEISEITTLIVAHDRDGNYSANTATVTVSLLDVNDNAPRFDNERVVIKTNATNHGDFVGTIVARDADQDGSPNANVTYEINTSWSPDIPFTVDMLSGNVTVDGTIGDQPEHAFFIKACDNPVDHNNRRCGVANVVVLVKWNGTLTEENLNLEVVENSPLHTPIKVLLVQGDRYECTSTEFGIDSTSHTLETRGPIDREQNATFEFEVTVLQYDEVIGNVSVSLTVVDVNDNAPVFDQRDYFINISPDVTDNQLLTTIKATDDDLAENKNLTFSLQNINKNVFFINGSSGDLKAGKVWSDPMQRLLSVYQFICVATDNGTPRLQSSVTVVVSFIEMKDNTTVGLQTPVSVDVIEKHEEAILNDIASILDVESVQKVDIVESKREGSTILSILYISTTNDNNTITAEMLQRKLIEHWSSIQDLFRQYMTVTVTAGHTDARLSTSEIALIAIAGALFIGTLVLIGVVCRQWKRHVKAHHLYDSLRRPSTMYDSQEMRMDFGHEIPSRFSTFRRGQHKDSDTNIEGSFGLGYVNSAFANDDVDGAPKTPTWSTNDVPMIPRWNTSDSLKDAIESLEDLTSRLNAEDSISRVTNLSRERRSQKSNRSEPTTPRTEVSTVPNSQAETPRSNGNDDMDDQLVNGYSNGIRPLEDWSNKQDKYESTEQNTDAGRPDYENLFITPPVDYPTNIELDNNGENKSLKIGVQHADGDFTDKTILQPNEIAEESTAF